MRKITITAWLAIFDPFWTMINLLIFYDLFPGDGDVWYGKKMFEDAKMSFHTFPAEMIWSWRRPSTSVPELDKHSIERWFTHSEWLCFSRNSVKLPEGSMHVKLNTLWTWYIYVYINTCISIHTRRASVCVCACGCLMVCHFMCFMEFLPITYNTSSSQQ